MRKLLLLSLLFVSMNLWAQQPMPNDLARKINLTRNPTAAKPAPFIKGGGNSTQAVISQSFELPEFPPQGWVFESVVGNTVSWQRVTVGSELPGWKSELRTTAPPRGGNATAYVTYGDQDIINDEWLITPSSGVVNTGDSLVFWLRYIIPTIADSFSVLVSTTDNSPKSFTNTLFNRGFDGAADTGWVRRAFSLSSFVGQNIFIGFRNSIPDITKQGSAFQLDLVSVGGVNSFRPLSPFSLQSPPDGTRLVTSPTNPSPVSITWDSAAPGATYNWVFRTDTVSAPRLLSIPTPTNSLTLRNSLIDTVLAGLGLNPGDSVSGFWTVWAYKAIGSPGPDSLRARTNRAIRFVRQPIVLGPFNLLSPPTNTTVVTNPTSGAPVNIAWSRSGSGAVRYRWQFAASTSGNFLPALTFNSANSGLDTTLTLINSSIDAVLAGLGVVRGDSVIGRWRVVAGRSATDTAVVISSQVFNLTLRRQARGQIAVVYDTTSTQGRASRDSAAAVLTRLGRTFDLINRGPNSATLNPNITGYQTVMLLGEGTSVSSRNFTTSMKLHLQNGTTAAPARLLIYAEDVGRHFARTGSSSLDTVFAFENLGFRYLLDRPASGAAQRLVNLTALGGADSTVGPWPEVIRPSGVSGVTPLYRFGSMANPGDTLNALGRITPTYRTATFGVDLESLRRPVGQPLTQSPVQRLIVTGLTYVESIISTPVESGSTLPNAFSLAQNYPNPFNPTTNINYALPSVMDVKLEVFNLLGQKVATLVNARQQAGNYTVPFNAASFASGVYFYKIQAGNNLATKKMMLVK
jgi:hypothetical protein